MPYSRPTRDGQVERRRLLTTLVLAAACALVYVLLRLKPQSVLTQVVVVFVVVFGLREWFHPARFFRRMAGTCLAAAAAVSSTPFISAHLELDESSWIEFAAGSAAWGTPCFLVAAVVFGLMEFFRTHQTRTSNTELGESLHVTAAGQQNEAAGRDVIKAEAGSTLTVIYGDNNEPIKLASSEPIYKPSAGSIGENAVVLDPETAMRVIKVLSTVADEKQRGHPGQAKE